MPSAKRGNTSKYESYKEAWRRIRAARKAEFFLEAVVIEESILADRLVSFLSRPGRQNPIVKDRKGKWPSFGLLIEALRREFPSGLTVGGCDNLAEALDEWRVDRNAAVHAIAKSDPGTPSIDVSEFLAKASAAAKRGEELARVVSKWQKSGRRRAL